MPLTSDGMPRPDHGPGWRDRLCRACGASWVGHEHDGDEWCPWCEQAAERQLLEQRRLLLDPPWLRSDEGNRRYDELSDVDRAVWDRTRGQTRGTDSVMSWVARLRRAADVGVVTQQEAERAIRRVAR